MATHVIFHEVDDVEHWLQSPKREEVFGPLGITIRTFRDPQGSNRVGLIAEIPDMDEFQEFTQTDAAAEAMKHDGVRSLPSRDCCRSKEHRDDRRLAALSRLWVRALTGRGLLGRKLRSLPATRRAAKQIDSVLRSGERWPPP